MSADPQRLDTEVFTRLPERLHHRGTPSPWAEATRPGVRLHSFLEGPLVDHAGNLFCVDVAYGRIFRISAAGEWSVIADYDGEPGGLALHRDGRLFIADHRNGILTMNPDGGRPEAIVSGDGGERFLGCSDLAFTGSGDLYFTDPGWSSIVNPTGRLFRLDGAGKLRLVIDGIAYPNGVVPDAGEGSLFLAVTYANAVWRVVLSGGSRPPRASLFVQLSGGLGPDGLALDEAGNLAVAHARNGIVWLIAPDGETLCRIVSCAGPSVTNLAYGGEDMRTVFITEADTGSILTARLPVPGRATFGQL